MKPCKTKPAVRLVGEDGNVFSIIGRCTKAARKAGWTAEEVSQFREDVTHQEDYDAVLRLVMDRFDVE